MVSNKLSGKLDSKTFWSISINIRNKTRMLCLLLFHVVLNAIANSVRHKEKNKRYKYWKSEEKISCAHRFSYELESTIFSINSCFNKAYVTSEYEQTFLIFTCFKELEQRVMIKKYLL